MHTVIVGGGFAGVKAALELSKRQLGRVTLISSEPYFLHHATLYATATGRSRSESVIPLEEIFRNHPRVTVVRDRMKAIDVGRKLVVCRQKDYKYDDLVIGIGMVTAYFGVQGMAAHSFGIKTLGEVREFKNHLHEELASDGRLDRNYVVIGAGPTGVELAGALKEYLERIARAHHIRRVTARVTLVEAAPRILPTLSKTASRKVQRRLEKMGVKVLTGHKVAALDDDYVLIAGKKVPTKTAIWTSGVTNHPFFERSDDVFELTPGGRVSVNQYMEVRRHIYVIGDNAATPHAGLARTALRDGKFVARHLAKKHIGRPLARARHKKPPVSLAVGDNWAYAEWKGIYAAGRTGYLLRRLSELSGYLSLLPPAEALKAWRSRGTCEESCKLCKISQS